MTNKLISHDCLQFQSNAGAGLCLALLSVHSSRCWVCFFQWESLSPPRLMMLWITCRMDHSMQNGCGWSNSGMLSTVITCLFWFIFPFSSELGLKAAILVAVFNKSLMSTACSFVWFHSLGNSRNFPLNNLSRVLVLIEKEALASHLHKATTCSQSTIVCLLFGLVEVEGSFFSIRFTSFFDKVAL